MHRKKLEERDRDSDRETEGETDRRKDRETKSERMRGRYIDRYIERKAINRDRYMKYRFIEKWINIYEQIDIQIERERKSVRMREKGDGQEDKAYIQID